MHSKTDFSFEVKNLRKTPMPTRDVLLRKIDNFRPNRKLDQAVVTVCSNSTSISCNTVIYGGTITTMSHGSGQSLN